MSLARMRKALVAVVGLLAVLATQLPPDAPEALQRWAPVVIGVATVLGVYRIPNRQPQPAPMPTVTTSSEGVNHVTGSGTSRVGQVYDQTRKPPTR